MRGARHRRPQNRPAVRIIPADAGSTTVCRPEYMTQRGSSPRMRGALGDELRHPGAVKDHPRGCGEHRAPASSLETEIGSSPRMRGALLPWIVSIRSTRIIPADAGSTRPVESGWSHCEDHPRGCGEHYEDEDGDLWIRGSSPRMRGALDAWKAKPDDERIIPADAGSTLVILRAACQNTDHPRGCGEHRPDHGPHVDPTWIIPADAGSTCAC